MTIASICNCYDNNDDPSIINEYFNSESFDDESTSDYTTSSIFISSISTTKPEQESKSFWTSSLISLFESILQSFDKKTTNHLDPLLQKLEPGSNNIIQPQKPHTEIDSDSIKFSTISTTTDVDIISDYDEEDRKFFEYNLSNNENNSDEHSDNKTDNGNVTNMGECETINGTMGECRAPPVCMKREPKRSAFSLCSWSHHPLTGARLPVKLCCEKRQSSTTKDLTNEADVEKQWQKQLELGFGNNEQSSMGLFWNLAPHPMALIQNSLIAHHHFQQQFLPQQHSMQRKCGQTMFHRNHRREKFMRYIYEIPDRRTVDLESDDQFYLFLNQTSKIRTHRTHSPRIVSGVSVANGEIPWIVSIYLRDTFTCGGSLISDRFVLTAAHCFTNAKFVDCFHLDFKINFFNLNFFQIIRLVLYSIR